MCIHTMVAGGLCCLCRTIRSLTTSTSSCKQCPRGIMLTDQPMYIYREASC